MKGLVRRLAALAVAAQDAADAASRGLVQTPVTSPERLRAWSIAWTADRHGPRKRLSGSPL